ncbi:MAG: hypothetical protein JSS66_13485 [Armatimonadetes bacterium]|nr:hypothetical protein [Armatimonadota bacterium]
MQVRGTVRLRFVCFKDEGTWLAYGIDHKILASSRTVEDLPNQITRVLDAYMKLGGIEAILSRPPAPLKYARMYRKAVRLGHTFQDAVRQESQERVSYEVEIKPAA